MSMPTWSDILNEINLSNKSPLDVVRRKYLLVMHKYTGRNIIAYYSGFLQKQDINTSIDDNDKNALMQAVCGLDKNKGLDLILHTPGGDIAATESIVEYIKSIFGNDVRAFVPQLAMSAGTMIALSCKEIIMGKQSNIGPIDPQYGGISCAGVVEEFEKAKVDILSNPNLVHLWQPILSRYHPTFLGDCEKAIQWSQTIVQKWIEENMMSSEKNPTDCAKKIVDKLSSHSKTFNHSRHIDAKECINLGIKVTMLESFPKKRIGGCKDLQDCVLAIHHSYMQTFSASPAIKIIENHNGNAMIISSSKIK